MTAERPRIDPRAAALHFSWRGACVRPAFIEAISSNWLFNALKNTGDTGQCSCKLMFGQCFPGTNEDLLTPNTKAAEKN